MTSEQMKRLAARIGGKSQMELRKVGSPSSVSLVLHHVAEAMFELALTIEAEEQNKDRT